MRMLATVLKFCRIEIFHVVHGFRKYIDLFMYTVRCFALHAGVCDYPCNLLELSRNIIIILHSNCYFRLIVRLFPGLTVKYTKYDSLLPNL